MIRIAALLPLFVASTMAFSQTEIETLNLELQRLQKVKEQTIQTDLEVRRVLNENQRLVNKYKTDVESFGREREKLDKIISKRSDDFIPISDFIDKTMDAVLNQNLSPERIRNIRSSYQDLKRTNNACANESTYESFRKLAILGAGIASVQSQMKDLTSSRRLPENFNELYDKISSQIPSISEVVKGVGSVVTYYSGILKYPEPCSAINSLDTILVLAQVAAEADQAASGLEKVSLSAFLKDIEIQKNGQRAESHLRRTLTGYEGKAINALRSGQLDFSMRTAASFTNDLHLMATPFIKNEALPLQSRKSVELQIENTSKRLSDEYNLAKLDTMEGQRRLLVIRAKVVHTKASQINGMAVPADLVEQKNRFISYCQDVLKLSIPGRFILSPTRTVDANLDMDAKIAAAEELLMPLEKGLSR